MCVRQETNLFRLRCFAVFGLKREARIYYKVLSDKSTKRTSFRNLSSDRGLKQVPSCLLIVGGVMFGDVMRSILVAGGEATLKSHYPSRSRVQALPKG